MYWPVPFGAPRRGFLCEGGGECRGAGRILAPGAHFDPLPTVGIPHNCTDLFVVASVLLDTVKNNLEMVLFCEVSNTL